MNRIISRLKKNRLDKRRLRSVPFNRLVPNMITSGSVISGMCSLILTYERQFVPSAMMLIMAVFFDFMDGRVARSLGGGTDFGEELDSLADALSFGAAPAFLIYARYIASISTTAGAMAAAFFALCGTLRLARFNVTHVPGSFQGLPIPAAGMTLAACVTGRIDLPPEMAVVALLVLGALMVSSIPYGNVKQLRRGNVNKFKAAFVVCVIAACFIFLREKGFLACACIYAASGPIGIDWGRWLALRPEPETQHDGGGDAA